MAAKLTSTLRVRLSAMEKGELAAEAEKHNVSLSDFVRNACISAVHSTPPPVPKGRPPKRQVAKRVSYSRADPDLIRNMAAVGNNINQLSRWANTYKTDLEAIAVLSQLSVLERDLQECLALAKRPPHAH